MAIVTAELPSNLPTNYEYYTGDGVKQGLSANQTYFTLNDKLIQIYSGAMHYFRVPRPYWRDRLRKLRAAGLNTVETYVPWNLHEPKNGSYDFGEGGSEFEDFLHLEEFLTTAKEEDLFVILRTGPYICSEFNFGGFPSWLLREETMGFRTSEQNYMKYVTRFFNILLTMLTAFQFTKGGPVMAFQVENEYGNLENGDSFQPDKVYMEQLRQIFLDNGIVELLVTSDSPLYHGTKGTLPGELFQTANFGDDAARQLATLQELQPGRPLMVMEYWIGWYDNFGASHSVKSDDDSRRVLEDILAMNSSVNFYMFHGGTNFGFNNGANFENALMDNSGYNAITTSYDYDAPVSESGGYKNKYYIVRELLNSTNPVKTFLPDIPEVVVPVAYQETKIQRVIPLEVLIKDNAPIVYSSVPNLIPMEKIDINDESGQSNGYIMYRKEGLNLDSDSSLMIKGNVYDTVLVLVNGELVAPKKLSSIEDLDGFGYWRLTDSSTILNTEPLYNASLTLLVENMGRVHGANIFQYNQTFKGLWKGDVTINGEPLHNWNIIPFEMKRSWMNNMLTGWIEFNESIKGPGLYQTQLEITEEPKDTFVQTTGWSKGMVFVNGFALGRYAAIGPQFSLYLPAPFLVQGVNNITFFEHFEPPESGYVNYVDQLMFANTL